MWIALYMPNREDIESLQVGDQFTDTFDKMQTVTEVTCKREDIHGKMFVHFYMTMGNGHMSDSLKENELRRTSALCRHFNSAQLDTFENFMRRNGIQKLMWKVGDTRPLTEVFPTLHW